jgi:hypothetical protein
MAHRDRKHVNQSNCFGCKGYIDNNCLFAHIGNLKYYPSYGKYFPTDQTKLLELRDEIRLPYEDQK